MHQGLGELERGEGVGESPRAPRALATWLAGCLPEPSPVRLGDGMEKGRPHYHLGEDKAEGRSGTDTLGKWVQLADEAARAPSGPVTL